jgi:adenylosuccinate synthase
MPAVIVVGAQWGDEGKGKVTDLLAPEAQHIVRAQGGNNAGHTVIIGSEEYKLHLVPSGILHDHTQCYIGGGTVLDPQVLLNEIEGLSSRGIKVKGRLWISPEAHVIFPYHQMIDKLSEQRKGSLSIGTTGKGIGPCYSDKANRLGIRIGDLIHPTLFRSTLEKVLPIKNDELTKLYNAAPCSFDELFNAYRNYAAALAPFVTDIQSRIYSAFERNENVLLEGAQGTFLDITHGTYPFVTSSNTIAAGICTGAGVGPNRIDHVLGVVKAYTTRVGHGPMPTEINDNETFLDHKQAREFGTTTGRKRRVGWFDAVVVRQAAQLNGFDSMAVTKLDILDSLKEIKIGVGYQLNGKQIDFLPSQIHELENVQPIYETLPGWCSPTTHIGHFEQLPSNAKSYLKRLETLCKTPISVVSLGPERERTLILSHPFKKSRG